MISRCADCGGIDHEWMYRCSKHGADHCPGCECPGCMDDWEDEDAEQPTGEESKS